MSSPVPALRARGSAPWGEDGFARRPLARGARASPPASSIQRAPATRPTDVVAMSAMITEGSRPGGGGTIGGGGGGGLGGFGLAAAAAGLAGLVAAAAGSTAAAATKRRRWVGHVNSVPRMRPYQLTTSTQGAEFRRFAIARDARRASGWHTARRTQPRVPLHETTMKPTLGARLDRRAKGLPPAARDVGVGWNAVGALISLAACEPRWLMRVGCGCRCSRRIKS